MRLVLIFLAVIFMFSPAYAMISSVDLVENSQQYDGKIIEYEGEAIGDLMFRGNHAWINVSDGGRAIGIFADKSLADQIKTVGDYNHIGDTVKAIGTFNRACREHGGDLDIHARELYIVRPGHKIEHTVNQSKLIIAGILLAAILAVILIPSIIKRFSS